LYPKVIGRRGVSVLRLPGRNFEAENNIGDDVVLDASEKAAVLIPGIVGDIIRIDIVKAAAGIQGEAGDKLDPGRAVSTLGVDTGNRIVAIDGPGITAKVGTAVNLAHKTGARGKFHLKVAVDAPAFIFL